VDVLAGAFPLSARSEPSKWPKHLTENHEHGCDKCSNHSLAELEQVGQPDQSEVWESTEVWTRYRCKSCGAKWTHLKESGISKGSFWNRGWAKE